MSFRRTLGKQLALLLAAVFFISLAASGRMGLTFGQAPGAVPQGFWDEENGTYVPNGCILPDGTAALLYDISSLSLCYAGARDEGRCFDTAAAEGMLGADEARAVFAARYDGWYLLDEVVFRRPDPAPAEDGTAASEPSAAYVVAPAGQMLDESWKIDTVEIILVCDDGEQFSVYIAKDDPLTVVTASAVRLTDEGEKAFAVGDLSETPAVLGGGGMTALSLGFVYAEYAEGEPPVILSAPPGPGMTHAAGELVSTTATNLKTYMPRNALNWGAPNSNTYSEDGHIEYLPVSFYDYERMQLWGPPAGDTAQNCFDSMTGSFNDGIYTMGGNVNINYRRDVFYFGSFANENGNQFGVNNARNAAQVGAQNTGGGNDALLGIAAQTLDLEDGAYQFRLAATDTNSLKVFYNGTVSNENSKYLFPAPKSDAPYSEKNPDYANPSAPDILSCYYNLQLPFIRDGNGFYNFDSDHYHSHVYDDSTAGDVKLPLYQPNRLPDGRQVQAQSDAIFGTWPTPEWWAGGGWFPFSDFDGQGGNTAATAIRRNCYWGMRMDVPFYMPEGGKTSTGEDMIFDFIGDDDVWVYIDGKLALDLGGRHGRAHGTINFATGVSTCDLAKGRMNIDGGVDGFTQTAYNREVTWDLYSDDEKGSTEGLIGSEGITREAYKKHTLTIFYMERGGGDSNCYMRFNIAPVDGVQVFEESSDGSYGPGDDPFEFEVFTIDRRYCTYDIADLNKITTQDLLDAIGGLPKADGHSEEIVVTVEGIPYTLLWTHYSLNTGDSSPGITVHEDGAFARVIQFDDPAGEAVTQFDPTGTAAGDDWNDTVAYPLILPGQPKDTGWIEYDPPDINVRNVYEIHYNNVRYSEISLTKRTKLNSVAGGTVPNIAFSLYKVDSSTGAEALVDGALTTSDPYRDIILSSLGQLLEPNSMYCLREDNSNPAYRDNPAIFFTTNSWVYPRIDAMWTGAYDSPRVLEPDVATLSGSGPYIHFTVYNIPANATITIQKKIDELYIASHGGATFLFQVEKFAGTDTGMTTPLATYVREITFAAGDDLSLNKSASIDNLECGYIYKITELKNLVYTNVSVDSGVHTGFTFDATGKYYSGILSQNAAFGFTNQFKDTPALTNSDVVINMINPI